jgi:hypothetical protein
MKKGYSRLIIIDSVLPNVGASIFGSLMDINMIAISGIERTERHWRELLEGEGLEFKRILAPKSGRGNSVIGAVLKQIHRMSQDIKKVRSPVFHHFLTSTLENLARLSPSDNSRASSSNTSGNTSNNQIANNLDPILENPIKQNTDSPFTGLTKLVPLNITVPNP